MENTNEVTVLSEKKDTVNVLKNEKVNIKFIAKARGSVQDSRHVLYGGMHQKAKVILTTPLLRDGGFVNVLTKEEKDCLEKELGLEPNALSVHKTENNYWSDANEKGAGRVTLVKGDNIFDLSDPRQYIKYKIAVANKDIVAPSMEEYTSKYKATWRFVVIREEEIAHTTNLKVSKKAEAYMAFGKINEDKDKLKFIIEVIDGRPVAEKTKIEFMQGKVGELLESNTQLFLNVVNDEYLDTKILIRKAVSKGILTCRGNFYYERETNTPLCENGEDPTLNIAAKYLNNKKHQTLKFSIEAKIKD